MLSLEDTAFHCTLNFSFIVPTPGKTHHWLETHFSLSFTFSRLSVLLLENLLRKFLSRFSLVTLLKDAERELVLCVRAGGMEVRSLRLGRVKAGIVRVILMTLVVIVAAAAGCDPLNSI